MKKIENETLFIIYPIVNSFGLGPNENGILVPEAFDPNELSDRLSDELVVLKGNPEFSGADPNENPDLGSVVAVVLNVNPVSGTTSFFFSTTPLVPNPVVVLEVSRRKSRTLYWSFNPERCFS